MATQSPYVSCLRGFSPGDKTENLDVNSAVWRKVMSVSLQAAVHLAKDYSENPRSTRKQSTRSLKQLFHISGKLITDPKEITGFPMLNWQQLTWQRTTLLTDKAVQFATAKTFVLSDSVLCLARIITDPIKARKEKINWFMESGQFGELGRIDVEPMEFEWKIFRGFTTLGILTEIQNLMTEIKCEPEHFQGKIIFMSMYNHFEWENKVTEKIVFRIL